MKEIIKNEIKEVIKEIISQNENYSGFKLGDLNFEITYAREEKFGDWSSNVAMMLAGKLKTSPMEIAAEIAKILEVKKIDNVDKIEVIAPGYINFYLAKKYFNEKIGDIIKLDKKWGETNDLTGKKYIFEHSSPNLFKPFHVGHLVNNSIGESLVRIIRKSGVESLTTLSFPSDISPGIAKTVWAIKEKKWENEMTISKIGEAYAFGSKEYEENEKSKEEINIINKILYLKEEPAELEIYKKGQQLSLDYFKEITERLGSKFDDLIFESESEEVGKEIVKENIPNIFRESEGAIIFPGSEHGLFDNVFINSQGFGTYLAKDIGLLKIKFDKFSFDKSITITDVEQREHFKLVKKAAELVNKEWSDKSEYIQHGRLNLLGIKISSRLGNVPLAQDLIESVKNRILEKIKEQDFSSDEKEEIAEKVAVGALKYSILKCGAGRNIVFDLEKATSFEGDTGPYLQYALVRTNSILNNAEDLKIENEGELGVRKGEVPNVEKMILKFPVAIGNSLRDNSPHHVANYLYNLASEFSSFYAQTKVLDTANPDFKNNLALVRAMQITLKNGLELLGMESLERM
ncbi:MAG TPA: arginine--tRNA ligase [Candidatus Moranbacteria bacterium]|nr:arginine--tRNA ligase [Candidatus Moranbacteria bacterium]